MAMKFPEQYRINPSHLASRRSKPGDRHGCFLIPASAANRRPVALRCVVSSGDDWPAMVASGILDGLGKGHVIDINLPWEHVSVSPNGLQRTPTWEEMCKVKSTFWDDEDCVVQFHPPRSEYVNCAAHCLHLWRPVGLEVIRPPYICVGDRP